MKFYHSLGNMAVSGLDIKLKDIHDFIKLVLKVLERLLACSGSEKSDQVLMPYLIIDTDCSRLFIIKNSQIVSFAFPFNLVQRNFKWKIYCLDLEVTSSIVSVAQTISEECKDNPKIPYSVILENYDKNIADEYAGMRLYERIAFTEPSYLRYDFDPRGCKGRIHPLNHLDVNYGRQMSYKVGLYKSLTYKDFETILFPITSCWYLNNGNELSIKRLELKNRFSKRKLR